MLFRLRNFSACLTLTALLTFPALSARSLESPWVDTGKANVRLLAAGADVTDRATKRAGLEIRLAPGWYTYWRYPGDAGVPPRFDWSGSVNLGSVETLWPAPQRIAIEDGLASIGYKHAVIFPLKVRPKDPGKPIGLRLKLDFGVCERICIPAEARLALEIPPKISLSLPALDAAEDRVPVAASVGDSGDLRVLAAELDRSGKPRALIDVAVPGDEPFDLFAEGPTDEWTLPLPSRLKAHDGRATFSVPIDGAPTAGSQMPSRLRLTLTAGERAIEVTVPLD